MINLLEVMISCVKGSSDLAGFHWNDIWTGTTSVRIPFLICTALFLVSTRLIRNSSVLACILGCSSAAIGVETGEYGTVP